MANNTKIYYNYLYIDPRDNQIFYIGKGTGLRSTEHLSDVKKHRIPNLSNYPLYTKIKELLTINKSPIIIILNYTTNEQDAYTKEKELIEKAKKNNQPLCNLTDGGDEFTSEQNRVSSKKRWATPEFREKMSKISGVAQRTPEARKQRSEIAKKMWADKEFKEKMKKIKKETSSTNEFRAKMSQIAKEYNNSLEVKERHSKRMKEKWADPQYKKDISEKISKAIKNNPKVIEARKKTWSDPERKEKLKQKWTMPGYREHLSEKRKNAWQRPEYREKMKATRNDPAHKQRTSEIRKAFWLDPVYRAKSHEAQRLARIKKKEMRVAI